MIQNKKMGIQDPKLEDIKVCQKIVFQAAGESLSKIKLAQDDTFVASVWIQSGMYHIFKHFNQKAEIKAKLELHVKGLQQFYMATPHEAIIVAKESKKKECLIILWNILTNSYTNHIVSLVFEDEWPSSIETMFFKNTNLLCLCEISKQQKFNLSYLSIPFGENKDPLLCSYTFCSSSQEQKFQVYKLNQSSKVAIICKNNNNKSSNTFETILYSLTDQLAKNEVMQIKLRLNVDIDKIKYLQCRIADIWEVDQNLLYVQCQSFFDLKEYFKNKSNQTIDEKYQRYHNFYFNTLQQTCRTGELNPPQAHRLQFIHSIRQINYKQPIRKIPQIMKFAKTYNSHLNTGSKKQVPIYYISCWNEKIVAINQCTKKPNEEFQMRWTDYKSVKMIVLTQEWSTREIVIRILEFPADWVLKQYGMKIITSFFMTELVESCCDDLVQYVSQMIQT